MRVADADTEKAKSHWMDIDLWIIVVAMIVAIVTTVGTITAQVGWYDFRFSERTIIWSMRISAGFWILLLGEFWRERKSESRDLVFTILAIAPALASVAGNFDAFFVPVAMYANPFLWLLVLVRLITKQREE